MNLTNANPLINWVEAAVAVILLLDKNINALLFFIYPRKKLFTLTLENDLGFFPNL